MKISDVKQKVIDLGYDTGGRSLDVTKVLNLLLPGGKKILDAGCGERGLKDYFRSADVTSTDINIFNERLTDRKFICSDITKLPFADNAFSISASVDVIEHLPVAIREKAVSELVRVSQQGVVLAFPCGQLARRADETFHTNLSQTESDYPEWLTEHLENPYPEADNIISIIKAEAGKNNKKVEFVKSFYSEHIKITQILRWSAAKSKYIYLAANSILGFLFPIIPMPAQAESYRAIILVKFESPR